MSKFARSSVVLLLVVAIPVLSSAQRFSFDSTPGQLPKDALPEHYSISITPDLNALMFTGSETIDVNVRKPGRSIVLNSLGLNVICASLADDTRQAAKVNVDAEKQMLTLTFPNVVPAGKHKLELEFEGKLGEQPQRLFYAKYPTASGMKLMLATQMEPTHARRMFPCWDEPAYRATYQLTVTVPRRFMTISNTPIDSERVITDDRKTVVFGKIPKMSSYLMVFVAGELEALSGEIEGVQLRVITTEGKKDTGQYAMEAAKKILPFFNEYFFIRYPLSKLDLIAVPGGFSDAMENWGAITFDESILLFDPKASSQEVKEGIFQTLAHEIAHQWFGEYCDHGLVGQHLAQRRIRDVDGTKSNQSFLSGMEL